MKIYLPIAVIAFLSISCAHTDDVTVRPAPACPEINCVRTHENLDATLYLQTAAEYEAIALQTFRMAQELAERGLADPTWSATTRPARAHLPPAVIVDVDETVLDNSAYQARLILDDTEFGSESWAAWVEEAAADPVPGALEFVQWADANGITMFYVTNRTGEEEAATRRNLLAAGFPVRDDIDTVLTKGEREEWVSDKTTRRAHVDRDFRVLLLIGDDLGDFLPRDWTGVESRSEMVAASRDRWGKQWLVLPNPTYGSWINSLFPAPPESSEERLEILYEALDPKRE
ncbi:MAG TPA: HAD family acid phosphatase [Thermoanaerobaculia bacterium]|nr:HAD family acid phosphatase [Thermoanaerobaculia bacterium]